MANIIGNSTITTGASFSQLLWMTLGPVIFFAGCFGNITILLVLRKRTMGTTITNVYVKLIAVADLIVLIIGMVNEWLKVSKPKFN